MEWFRNCARRAAPLAGHRLAQWEDDSPNQDVLNALRLQTPHAGFERLDALLNEFGTCALVEIAFASELPPLTREARLSETRFGEPPASAGGALIEPQI